MANCTGQSFAGQIKILMETRANFSQRLKQQILCELSTVKNHFQFIGDLLAKEVLSDGSIDSERNVLLKEMMAQHAVMIACSRDADGIAGLMEAMEMSGNSGFNSALRTWAKEEFTVDLQSELIELQENDSAVRAPTVQSLEKRGKIVSDFASEADCEMSDLKGDTSTTQAELTQELPKTLTSSTELSSVGAKLMDIIRSLGEEYCVDHLQGHLVCKATRFNNVKEFCSSLQHLTFQDEKGQLKLSNIGMELGDREWTKIAIKAACSNRAIESLISALQQSGNHHILEETYELFEKSLAKYGFYPFPAPSILRDYREDKISVTVTFFEQAAPSSDLQKVATFDCQPEPSSEGTFALTFDKDRMTAHLADGTVKLWHWRENEEKTIKFEANLIEWFQYDKEIIVLGTGWNVHLFDTETLQERSFFRLPFPVHSFKLVGSTVIVLTEWNYYDLWWVDISGSEMKILSKRTMRIDTSKENAGIYIYEDYTFFYSPRLVKIYETKSGKEILDNTLLKSCYLSSSLDTGPINAFNVVDFISTKRVVVAGCTDGMIEIWKTCELKRKQRPVKSFRGHTEAIVSLCAVNGHLLSLDKKGKLFMWSGLELENEDVSAPTPRVLAENFYNVTNLAAHERWFASSSSKDGIVNVWAVPDLWLRTD